MLRTLAHIPRLNVLLQAGRLQLQIAAGLSDGELMQRIDELRVACEAVRDSRELHALIQIVLNVTNVHRAVTNMGNAVGFKLSTLLKLTDLKALDKQSTLLHFVVEAASKSAHDITAQVLLLQKAVGEAARVSLKELQMKQREFTRGLKLVDEEIFFHDEQLWREGKHGQDDEDSLQEDFTELYNWAAEQCEIFGEQIEEVTKLFTEVHQQISTACSVLMPY